MRDNPRSGSLAGNGDRDDKLQADLVNAQREIGNVGFDVALAAAAGGQLQGSHTWTFPNAAAAKAFSDQVNSSGGWGSVLHDIAGPIGGGLLDLVGIHGAPDPSSLAPKNLTYSYISASLVGQLNGNANFGLGEGANAQLDAELKAAGGARLITTNPANLNPQSGQNEGEVAKALNLNVSDGSGSGYQYTGTLNLANDPSAKMALAQLLGSGTSGQGVSTLIQQMSTQGSERVQPYTVSRSQSGAGLELAVVDIGGGGQATVSQQNQSFSPGYVKPPNGTWQQVVCEK